MPVPPESVPAPSPAPLTGGAALLARLRPSAALRDKKAESAVKSTTEAAAPRRVLFLYGSQTGTAQEISRNMHAEALQKGLKAECLSLSEVPLSDLTAAKSPVVVVVVSSTGDGDPPDNAALSYVTIKKPQPADLLAGVHFTLLGLGDSNYTRFMGVPRVYQKRFLELGAKLFYPAVEADEVDGIETKVDPWQEGLWEPLQQALAGKVVALVTPTVAAHKPTEAAAVSKPEPTVATPAVVPPAEVKTTPPAGAAEPTSPDFAKGEDVSVPRKDETAYGFDGQGLAAATADLKGAVALQPHRLKVTVEQDEAKAQQVRAAEAQRPSAEQLAARDAEGLYSTHQPFWAPVTDARYETASWSDRKVLHVEFGLEGSGIAYAPGDSIGVVPANSADLVGGVLKRLGRSGDEVVSLDAASADTMSHLPPSATLSYIFTHCMDLTSPPKKSLVRMLAEHCSDEAQKRTLTFLTARAGRDAYAHEIMDHQPSLLDLLQRFDSCHPPLDALLDVLPPLQPRLYSITSAPEACPDKAQVALSVVRFRTRYGSRLGLASNWLDQLAGPLARKEDASVTATARVGIFLKRSADFRPPADPLAPVIMVGPGTGVAPFRGFLQRRQAQLQALPEAAAAAGPARGDWVLFFGCRREDEDFLYRSDLEAFQADGTLTSLVTAFSRLTDSKVYVQHRMREQGAHLADLIVNKHAHVFVCGDGGGMARDVHAALRDILRDHIVASGNSEGEAGADAVLVSMVKERRYVRDIWS